MALLVAVWVSLLAAGASAQPIGGIDSPTARPDGLRRSCGSPASCSTQARVDRIELLVDGIARQPRGHEPAAPRRPRDLPDLRQQPDAEPRLRDVVPRARHYLDGPHTVSIRVTESDPGARSSLGPITVIVEQHDQPGAVRLHRHPGPAARAAPTAPSRSSAGRSTTSTSTTSISWSTARSWRARSAAGEPARRPSTASRGRTSRRRSRTLPNSAVTRVSSPTSTRRSFVNGIHILSVRATDDEGASREIGSRPVQVINNGQPPRAVRPDRLPARQGVAHLFHGGSGGRLRPRPCRRRPAVPGLCQHRQRLGPRRRARGSTAGRSSYVELLLDGAIIANTRARLLQVERAADQLLRHQPAGRRHALPGYVNADNAGFTLRLRVSAQNDPLSACSTSRCRRRTRRSSSSSATPPGKHTLAIRAGDEEGDGHAVRRDVGRHPLRPVGRQPAGLRLHRHAPSRLTSSSTGSSRSSAGPTTSRASCAVEVDVDGQVMAAPTTARRSTACRPDVPQNDPRVPRPATSAGRRSRHDAARRHPARS